MITVLFDSVLRTKKGKCIPFWETSHVDKVTDNELVWFHVGYGVMRLYHLLQVDAENFIAEDLHTCCRTSNPKWEVFSEKPELALNS